MRKQRGALTDRSLKLLLSIVLGAALQLNAVPHSFALFAPYFSQRADKISDSTVNAIATHDIELGVNEVTTQLGSFKFEFCSNDPLPETPCTLPAGFDASTAVLGSQTGDTGFSIHPNSNANTIILTRPPSLPFGGQSAYIFDNIHNPSATGSYYIRLTSYSSTDATGPAVESGGIVFAIVPGLSINTEVPPYLRFCAGVTITALDCSTATSFFIDVGELRSNQTSKASSQFLAATNAEFGYSVTLSGTTLTSGNNVIPALSSPSGSSTGTSQFGINLKANTNPSVGDEATGPGTANATNGYNLVNQYKYNSGDVIVTVPNSNDNRKFTVSYIANINGSQPPGYYTTTISFICLANF